MTTALVIVVGLVVVVAVAILAAERFGRVETYTISVGDLPNIVEDETSSESVSEVQAA